MIVPSLRASKINLDLSLKRLFSFFLLLLSHISLKAQQPFALLGENFGSSPAKTEDGY